MEQKIDVIYKNSIKIEKILKYLLRKHSLLNNSRLSGRYKVISHDTLRELEKTNYYNLCTVAKLLHIRPNLNDANTDKEQWSLDLDKYYLNHNFDPIATAKHFNKIKYCYNRSFISSGTVINNHEYLISVGKSYYINTIILFNVIKFLLNKDIRVYQKSYQEFEHQLVDLSHYYLNSIGHCLRGLIRKRFIVARPHNIIVNLPKLKKFYHQIDLKKSYDF